MKIPAAVREAAIVALRCEADDLIRRGPDLYQTESDRGVDAYLVSVTMGNVWDALYPIGKFDNSDGALTFEILEAAALLEDGWSPGDPVVRR